MKRSTYIWSLLVGCVAFATSCDLTENVQVKADKSMIFGSKSGLELYSNSFYKALPTLKNGFMQDKMCDVGAVSNTDTFIKQGAYNTETATSWSWGTLKNVNYFIDGCNDPKYCTVEAETRDNYLGIARWFRAWFYYDKLTTYGEVPWFPNDIQSYQNDVMYKDRDSRDVIIRNLIADLDFAYEHIQATSSTGSATLTRWAAAALKSRVCLFEAAYRRYHNLTGLEITPEELYREAAKAAKLVIDNSGCSLNTAAGKKGAYRDLFYNETPLTQEVILAVCANEKSGIFGEQNWWFNARSYGLCWSLVRSFVHTYLKQDGTPFTAAADYAVKSFAEEMEGRDLRLEQTVRGRNFLWDGKTAVADIKNLSLTGYQVIKYTLDESKYDGGAKNINSIPLIRYAEVLLNYAEAQAELGVITDSEWALTVGALRKRAGITGGTETLPTTVDSYLQRTFYPDVTSPVLLEIRRERAIELVAEGMRFDDLRRWKCGSLMETLPWTGIHIPGLEQPVDVNGDGIIDDKDITPTGFSNVPRFAFSSNLSFGYKGFEISALLTGSAQGTFNMNGYLITPFAQGNGTPLSYMNGRWTPERHAAGKQITFPRMSVNMANSQNNQNNSFWFRSTDHIKLKNVEVAYTFRNARWMRKAHIGSIRVFVNANNLCTWGGKDLVDGIDPELVQDGSTSEGIIYPLTRVYNFGFNIQF